MTEWRCSSTQCCRYPVEGVLEFIMEKTLFYISQNNGFYHRNEIYSENPPKRSSILYLWVRGEGVHLAPRSAEALSTPLHRRVLNLDTSPACVVKTSASAAETQEKISLYITERRLDGPQTGPDELHSTKFRALRRERTSSISDIQTAVFTRPTKTHPAPNTKK